MSKRSVATPLPGNWSQGEGWFGRLQACDWNPWRKLRTRVYLAVTGNDGTALES